LAYWSIICRFIELYEAFTFIAAICAYWNVDEPAIVYCAHIAPVAGVPTFIVVPETPLTGSVIADDCPDVNPELKSVLPRLEVNPKGVNVAGTPEDDAWPCGTNMKFALAQLVPVLWPTVTIIFAPTCVYTGFWHK